MNEDRYLLVGRLVNNAGRPSGAVWSCLDCSNLTTNRERHNVMHAVLTLDDIIPPPKPRPKPPKEEPRGR